MPDLRDDTAHPCRRSMVLNSQLQPLSQLPADRQQQRRLISQVPGPYLIEANQLFKYCTKQGLLALQGQALRKQRFETQYQPSECRTASTHFFGVDHRPMVLAEMTQQSEPG